MDLLKSTNNQFKFAPEVVKMRNPLITVSLSHKKAPLEIREAFSLSGDQALSVLLTLKASNKVQEALVIATCNRTEVYYIGALTTDEVIELLAREKEVSNAQALKGYFKIIKDNKESILSLFRVSMGLEAQVIGDMQISNQVKRAYQQSADSNMAGPFLHRLLHTIFFTNKKIVQETAFRDGAASVSYATAEMVKDLCRSFKVPNILIVGLGEIGEDTCRNLITHNEFVTITNRSEEKAAALANELGFKQMSFANWQEEITSYDIIISSVSTSKPIISKSLFDTNDLTSHKFLFDLSVPRSIEEDIESLPGLIVYNIDHIQSKTSAALEKRIAAIPSVEAIIEESITEFGNWTQEMEVSPTINKLKNALEDIRQEEINRYVKTLTDSESQVVEQVTKSMMQKIIKLPILQLKAACKRGEAETLIDVLNDLFDLETRIEKPLSK